jgi:hypothetical protein
MINVHDNLWKDVFELEDRFEVYWEYVGFIVRQTTDNDRLAMHLDSKNDSRCRYDICGTYSFVLDQHRITIVMASRQDWGRLMERLSGIKKNDGKFVSP